MSVIPSLTIKMRDIIDQLIQTGPLPIAQELRSKVLGMDAFTINQELSKCKKRTRLAVQVALTNAVIRESNAVAASQESD